MTKNEMKFAQMFGTNERLGKAFLAFCIDSSRKTGIEAEEVIGANLCFLEHGILEIKDLGKKGFSFKPSKKAKATFKNYNWKK